jgi:hypothetical protein
VGCTALAPVVRFVTGRIYSRNEYLRVVGLCGKEKMSTKKYPEPKHCVWNKLKLGLKCVGCRIVIQKVNSIKGTEEI